MMVKGMGNEFFGIAMEQKRKKWITTKMVDLAGIVIKLIKNLILSMFFLKIKNKIMHE